MPHRSPFVFAVAARVSNLAVLALCALSLPAHAQTWTLAWSDEFNGSAHSAIDSAKWQFEYGDLKVNDELEWYCGPSDDAKNQPPCNSSQASNAFIDGQGHLVIQAFRITPDTAPSSKAWTSARMNTANNLASFQYGRIEARIKLPVGPGIWPAFWALGTNIAKVDWPGSGEIDFMENVPASGRLGPKTVKSTIHGPTYFGGDGLGQDYVFPSGSDVTAFHTYGAIWSPSMVQFYVDDPANVFFVRTASDVPGGPTQWAFNHPFFLLLNLAIGGKGSWPGAPDSTTPSPAKMLVDYVRVYKSSAVSAPLMTASPITLSAAGEGSSTLHLKAVSGGGLVYLECSGAPEGATCAIDSGNALNSHIVDFRASAIATATVRVTTTSRTAPAVPSSRLGTHTLSVTAFTLSGDTSTVAIPLAAN